MSHKKPSVFLELPEESESQPAPAIRRRFSVRLSRDKGGSFTDRATRRAANHPYPRSTPLTRQGSHTSFHSPDSRSPPSIPKFSPPPATSVQSGGSRAATLSQVTGKKVRFSASEDEDEDELTRTDDPPARTVVVDKGLAKPHKSLMRGVQGNAPDHQLPPTTNQQPGPHTIHDIAPLPGSDSQENIPTKLGRHALTRKRNAGGNQASASTLNFCRPEGDDVGYHGIRSGIKKLLEVNQEALMVDGATATALESLLSRLDGGSKSVVPDSGSVGGTADSCEGTSGIQRKEELTAIRTVRAFQGGSTSGHTAWWKSGSAEILARPPQGINPTLGDLYIHEHHPTSSVQMWIFCDAGTWEEVKLAYDKNYLPDRVIEGVLHPSFDNRRLKLRSNGDPSWIMKQTCITSKSRRKGASAQS